MKRFLIEIPHEDEHEACVRALDALSRHGSHFMTHAHFGCAAGHHLGQVLAEVDSRADAERMVPPQFRGDARIVEVQQFTRKKIEDLLAELES